MNRNTLYAILSAAAISLIACQTMDSAKPKEYVAVVPPDSLARFDPILVYAALPGQVLPGELLFSGDFHLLKGMKLVVPGYAGGDLILTVNGMHGTHLAYSMKVEYSPLDAKPRTTWILPEDTLGPEMSWSGPDTLKMGSLDTLALNGMVAAYAHCRDDRDIFDPIPVFNSGGTGTDGVYKLYIYCRDKAENMSKMQEWPLVVGKGGPIIPPIVPAENVPRITLLGPKVTTHFTDRVFTDSGAQCPENRVNPILVPTAWIDPTLLGLQFLTYVCENQFGQAISVQRYVYVLPPSVRGKDTVLLLSKDTLALESIAAYKEPVSICVFGVGDTTPPVIAGPYLNPGTGYHEVTHTCNNGKGKASKIQYLLVGAPASLRVMADAMVDTTRLTNNGGAGALGLHSEPENIQYFPMMRFNLKSLDIPKVKSARLRLYLYSYDGAPGAAAAPYRFQAYRLGADWIEGTGDWFYHRGEFRNGGDKWYGNYPIPDSLKQLKSDPAELTGVNGEYTPWLRKKNVTLVAEESFNLDFAKSIKGVLPSPGELTVIEMDMTAYVKSAAPDKDYGFYVQVEGDDLHRIGFTTKELGDGTWAPRLLLEY